MNGKVCNKINEYCLKHKFISDVTNYDEARKSNTISVVFNNGWVAVISENVAYPAKGSKYSIAIRDYYNGRFNFDILNEYGAKYGCLDCNTDDEVINAYEIIRKLPCRD